MGNLFSTCITEENAALEFNRAAKAGYVSRAKWILESFPAKRNEILSYKDLPLETAIFEGHDKFVEFLIKQNIDIDQQLNIYNGTAFELALTLHANRIALQLFEAGAKIPEDIDGLNALDYIFTSAELNLAKPLSEDIITLATGLMARHLKAHPNIILLLARKSPELALIYRLYNDDVLFEDLRNKLIHQASRDMSKPRFAQLLSMPMEEFKQAEEVQSLLRRYPKVANHYNGGSLLLLRP
ncbi:MAG: hypothetical protein SFW66_03660 [Gammaproteobacteria bacterium]|nr:hypothetical protein [Gammaproteobacteria bacterium]